MWRDTRQAGFGLMLAFGRLEGAVAKRSASFGLFGIILARMVDSRNEL